MDCYRQCGGDNDSNPSKSKLVSYSGRREIINIRFFFFFAVLVRYEVFDRNPIFFSGMTGTIWHSPVFKPIRNKHISIPSQALTQNIPFIPASMVRD